MTKPPPRFFWQGFLIVLPMVILVGMGLYSLRLDQALAEKDAKERAQSVADDLANQVWIAFTTFEGTNEIEQSRLSTGPPATNTRWFQIDAGGKLVFPPEYAKAPIPSPVVLSDLDPKQAYLWQAARAGNNGTSTPDHNIAAWQAFLAAKPTERFAAIAEYTLGLQLLGQGQTAAAIEHFTQVSQHYPSATGESGLLLKPLADWQRLQVIAARHEAAMTSSNSITRPQLLVTNLNAFCTEIIQQPSVLTPMLLTAANDLCRRINPGHASNSFPWLARWESHERARQFYQGAREQLLRMVAVSDGVSSQATDLQPLLVEGIPTVQPPTISIHPRPVRTEASFFWLSRDQVWLMAIIHNKTDSIVVGRSEQEVQAMLQALLHRNQAIPNYLGLSIDIAGHRQLVGSAPKSMRLAQSRIEPFTVGVYLTNPRGLYQNQRSRQILFGGLIALAVLVVAFGLAAAWRAFQRQLKLNVLKSNFVSSVSHELRAPIASVRLMAESLERGRVKSEEKKSEYFRFIVQECRRLSALIENVLDFSRIEQGRKQYEFEPTQLQALMQQTVKVMEPYAAERKVKLSMRVKDRPTAESNAPWVESPLTLTCDGRAIQQALVNLIDNAIKHSPASSEVTVGLESGKVRSNGATECWSNEKKPTGGNPLLHCSITPSPQSPFLSLWVEDHGDGIPPEEHEKIFERFYRRGSELRRETQGVGIGLSIVKHIVEAHGGHIQVRSAVGQGSRFTMVFPLNQTIE